MTPPSRRQDEGGVAAEELHRQVPQQERQEPSASTQEISAAQVRAQANPKPQGAAAAARPPQIPLAPIKRVQARFNPLADGMIYLVVFIGGMAGTALRYGLSLMLPATAASTGLWRSFHLPTFLANMVACFVFACLTSYISQATWIRKRVRQLTSRGVGMGMCGGFSTLSALAIEELTSLRADRLTGAMCYMLASFLGGLVVAWVGAKLGLAAATRHARVVLSETRGRQHGDRHVTGGQTIAVTEQLVPANGVPETVDVPHVAAPGGDYGQPQDQPSAVLPVLPVEGGTLENQVPPAYEPAPITDEIPLTGDPTTGEAH